MRATHGSCLAELSEDRAQSNPSNGTFALRDKPRQIIEAALQQNAIQTGMPKKRADIKVIDFADIEQSRARNMEMHPHVDTIQQP